MMKKVVLTLVLSLAVVANAGLYITVDLGDGILVDPADSTITITPSTIIKVGIYDDGQAQNGFLALGIADGPASLSVSNMVVSEGVSAMLADDSAQAKRLGLQDQQFVSMDVASPAGGMLISEVDFHCDGPWDVTIAVVDADGYIVDTQVIHQVPEPATLALMGIGGLLLRRRIA